MGKMLDAPGRAHLGGDIRTGAGCVRLFRGRGRVGAMKRAEQITTAERTYIVHFRPEPEGGYTVTLPGPAGPGELWRDPRGSARDGRRCDRRLPRMPARGWRADPIERCGDDRACRAGEGQAADRMSRKPPALHDLQGRRAWATCALHVIDVDPGAENPTSRCPTRSCQPHPWTGPLQRGVLDNDHARAPRCRRAEAIHPVTIIQRMEPSPSTTQRCVAFSPTSRPA